MKFPNLNATWRLLLTKSAASFVARSIGAGSQFLYTLVLVRWLGAGGMGVYALCFSTVTVASVLARAGMDLSALRFVALHQAQADRVKLKDGLRKMLLFTLLSSTVVSALVYGFSGEIAQAVFSEPQMLMPLKVMSLSLVPLAILNVLAEALRGSHRIGVSALLQVGLVPALSLALFFLLYLWVPSVLAAAIGFVVAVFIVCVLAWVAWSLAYPQLKNVDAAGGPSLKEMAKVSYPMTWVALTAMLMSLADTVILGLFRSSEEVGVYTACVRLSILISFILVAVNGILGPKFAALNKEEDRRSMEKFAQSGTLLILVLAGPILFVFLVFPEFALSLFGSQFSDAKNVLRVLVAGQFYNVTMGAVGLLLLMSGYERQVQWVNTLAVVAHIAVAMVLVPSMGMMGAATANVTGLVVFNTITLIICFKKLKVSTIPWISVAER